MFLKKNDYFTYKEYKNKYIKLKYNLNIQTGGGEEWNLENGSYYIGLCNIDENKKEIIKKNPHCAEFFCELSNVKNCSNCSNYLVKNKLFTIDPFLKKPMKNVAYEFINNNKSNIDQCKNQCIKGYKYDFIPKGFELESEKNLDINDFKSNVDKFKTMKNFYDTKFIYKYEYIPYAINYERTLPKPKSVIHWGQLKMFLVTLLFLVLKINEEDEIVHIIYAGSARGDNILILADMFPNTRWYLVDPNRFAEKLYNHKQIIEIKNEFFTDDSAHYYYEMFKNRDNKEKLLFISDIRLDPSDITVMEDNASDAKWHEIIKPNYSYLKFRCPYEGERKYDFYDGEIYIQPYAPVGSTEARLLLKTGLIPKTYDIDEYQGKFYYFNRIMRPAYYKTKLIKDNTFFDHCYDCTFFGNLMENYLDKFKKFSKNVFKNDNVLDSMFEVKRKLNEQCADRIKIINNQIRSNIK